MRVNTGRMIHQDVRNVLITTIDPTVTLSLNPVCLVPRVKNQMGNLQIAQNVMQG